MEYSLINILQNLSPKNLTVTEFVNTFNLIGLEVDDITTRELYWKKDQNLQNIHFLIKVPSNREDLILETFFLQEISLIFLFEIYRIWENVKLNYDFVLKQKYKEHEKFSTVLLNYETENFFFYAIEIENLRHIIPPLWVTEKLLQFGIEKTNSILDIFNLVIFEWGQIFNVEEKGDSENFKSMFVENYYQENIKCFYKFGKPKFQIKQDSSKFFIYATLPDFSKTIEKQNIKSYLKYIQKSFYETLKYSFQRLLTLLEILCDVKIVSRKYLPASVSLNLPLKTSKFVYLNKLILKNFLNLLKIDEEIFKKAGFKIVSKTANQYIFEISTVRKDINREIDIVEEYSRFVGYKNFQILSPTLKREKLLKNFEVIQFMKQYFLNYGFREIITNSILEDNKAKKNSIFLKNPLNKDLAILRTTLLPKLIEIFQNNSRQYSIYTNFFEIGRVFKIINNKVIEEEKLAAIFQLPFNQTSSDNYNWFIALGFIENFIANFYHQGILKEKIINNFEIFHPTRSITFKSGNNVLAYFGELSPKLKQFIGVQKPIYMLEINLKYFQIYKLYSFISIIYPISKYPIIRKDLSILTSMNINFYILKRFIIQNSENLKKVSFFDIYFENGIKHSIKIGLRLEFQSKNQTLTNEFIENAINNLKELIKQKFNVQFTT